VLTESLRTVLQPYQPLQKSTPEKQPWGYARTRKATIAELNLPALPEMSAHPAPVSAPNQTSRNGKHSCPQKNQKKVPQA